jgi:ABC-type multidrug transport system ATPase subunit
VVLLDEPSSGMDPLAKRNMWKTLAKFKRGRSILLTVGDFHVLQRISLIRSI